MLHPFMKTSKHPSNKTIKMPILEITLLRTLPPHNSSSSTVLSTLQSVRTALREKVHDTKSRFYSFGGDESLVFILGEWDSVAQHEEFLANDGTYVLFHICLCFALSE